MALDASLAVHTKAIESLQMGRPTEALAFYRTIVGTTVERAAPQLSSPRLEPSMIPGDTDVDPAESGVDSRVENKREEITDHMETSVAATPNISQSLPTRPLLSVWSVSMDEFMDEVPRPSDDVFALFHRPFDVQINGPGTINEQSLCTEILPIICMYNMGFIHHTMASLNQDGVERDALYREAVKCYQWSDYRLQEQAEANEVAFNGELDLFHLALLNNLGHCYAMLQRTDQAWSCWDRLQTQWTTTTQKRCLSQVDRIFYEARMAWGRRMKIEQYLPT